MAFRRSMGLRNKLLQGTQGFKQLMDGGKIRFFSGAQLLKLKLKLSLRERLSCGIMN